MIIKHYNDMLPGDMVFQRFTATNCCYVVVAIDKKLSVLYYLLVEASRSFYINEYPYENDHSPGTLEVLRP